MMHLTVPLFEQVWSENTSVAETCRVHMKRVPRALLRRLHAAPRCRAAPLLLSWSTIKCGSGTPAAGHAEAAGTDIRRFGNKSRNKGSSGSKFPPPTEAASVPFPGKDLRVSRVGFGSPWMGSAPDRGLDLSRYVAEDRVCALG